MIAAVVLAAGASTRLGIAKQLVVFGGETLLDRAVRVAVEAGCSPVVVVLGASAALIRERCSLHGAQVVVNEAWADGMASSIRCGFGALGDVDGCVVMTCDMPTVTSMHLRLLMVAGELTASSYAERRGVPAYFPVAVFAELMELHGDAGGRELLKSARIVELPGGEFDVDTVEELEQARKLFG
ncbi:NTP transferase domain-containing protein [Granulicella arctica]|uniref:CTP:molybdopterin cytidylyltransferase MocA n=1 Tax=Granulicella arctica TaxID=940613 RepID=A0A7Y9TGE0_9BACT|nr:CTP:molybdopterin cytidylyltransferase MocA [Granulicella arctica]